jgi:hypothetical protein
MRWPFRRTRESAARLPHAYPPASEGASSAWPGALPPDDADDVGALLAFGFTCTTCGRTDLPPAGDWDPPICEECDAAINFDAELEAGYFDDLN